MLPDAMATGGRLSPDHAYPFTGVGLSSEGVEAFEVTTIEATKVAVRWPARRGGAASSKMKKPLDPTRTQAT